MMNKRIMNSTILITLLIIFSAVVIRNQDLNVNMFNFLFNSFKIVILLIGIQIAKNHIKFISLGLGSMSIGLFFDLVSEFKTDNILIEQYSYLFQFSYNLFTLIGIIFIIAAIIKVLKQKNESITRLTQMAFIDPVTDLHNLNFIKEVNPLLNRDKPALTVVIDLDNFKLVNDQLGHHVGDQVLKIVADRLQSCVKAEDVVARIYGDEFVLILKCQESIRKYERIVSTIHKKVSQEIRIKEQPIHLHCSIGVANYPEDGTDIDTLIQHADLAMYTAKKAGTNQDYRYKKQLTGEISKRFSLQEEIKVAIRRKEFILYYQPKVCVKTNKITSIEALIRWDHPDIGIISPSLFIQIAEETGLIKKIDRQIIELACKQIKEWNDQGIKPVNISVNVSPILFKDQSFVTDVDTIINKYGIDPSYLTFEITEGIAIKNISQTIYILDQLKERQIKIALDDFGKGYSSLVYIKDFPIDTLKLDKGFIDKVLDKAKTREFFETIITYSRKLNIKVVAEGVESTEQLDYLKKISCDEYQGYIHSRPMPIENLQEQLNRN